MSGRLHIKVRCDSKAKEYYKNHSTFHEGDAGLDLFVKDTVFLQPNERGKLINLGVRCEARYYPVWAENSSLKSYPSSFYVVPRSSMTKTPLRQSNSVGIIDSGYRGDLFLPVDNISGDGYMIEAGTRLCQIVGPDLNSLISFELVEELTETTRGEGGFGSTNKN